MRYLILSNTDKPFFTDWYSHENNYRHGIGMKVFDLHLHKLSTDGKTWEDVEADHL